MVINPTQHTNNRTNKTLEFISDFAHLNILKQSIQNLKNSFRGACMISYPFINMCVLQLQVSELTLLELTQVL